MRNRIVFSLKLFFIFWIFGIFIIFIRLSSDSLVNNNRKFEDDKKLVEIDEQVDKLEHEIKQQSSFYFSLLDKLRALEKHRQEMKDSHYLVKDVNNVEESDNKENVELTEGPIIPVLMIACNREAAVKRSLELLLKYRPSKSRFPIIVSQDCGHKPTRTVILAFGDQVTLIEQPDLSAIEIPPKEKKFKGYFLIARHYKWALNQIFHKFNYETVIIVEDDLDVAPDFYEYFSATYPLLKEDSTLWCISAWNDNGKNGLVDIPDGADTLYRTDFFPGLGWMLTRDTWGELGPKWPRSYWDDWVRAPEQRQNRGCIRPELSRTRTFGKKGVSNGLFYEKHLKYIHLNTDYVHFTQMDLSYLLKENYDVLFMQEVNSSQVVTLNEVKAGRLPSGKKYRLIYDNKESFKKITKALGLMDDFKAGVPRTGYRGIISFFYGGKRIFLTPTERWKGYDPGWS